MLELCHLMIQSYYTSWRPVTHTHLLRKLVSTTYLAVNWSSKIGTWNIYWGKTWRDQIWTHKKHWPHWNKSISHHIKQIFFVFWRTNHWYREIATPKINWQIFTCISIQQIFILPELWSRHSTSNSKIVGCHKIRLFSISINKQLVDNIKIT